MLLRVCGPVDVNRCTTDFFLFLFFFFFFPLGLPLSASADDSRSSAVPLSLIDVLCRDSDFREGRRDDSDSTLSSLSLRGLEMSSESISWPLDAARIFYRNFFCRFNAAREASPSSTSSSTLPNFFENFLRIFTSSLSIPSTLPGSLLSRLPRRSSDLPCLVSLSFLCDANASYQVTGLYFFLMRFFFPC